MIEDSLWTAEDEAALETCRDALGMGALDEALLALDPVPLRRRVGCREQLNAWADEVVALPESARPEVQAAALRHVLADRAGLTGDSEDYHHPDNCSLSSVIDRRRGMPILIAAIWMLVGRRAGVPVEGVGLPGHFIARVGGGRGLLVDAFAGGRPMSQARCAQLVKRLSKGSVSWRPEFLRPVPLGHIVLRALRNRNAAHTRAGEHRAAYRDARLSALLFPELGSPRLVEARAAEALDLHHYALGLYRVVARRFPLEEAGRVAADRVNEMGGALPPLH